MKQGLSRVKWIDMMKGVGVLCMILGHLYAPHGLSYVIYSFHMPLFFIISGYFFNLDAEPQRVFAKGLKYYIFPYALTCLIMFLISFFVDKRKSFLIIKWMIRGFYAISSNAVPGRTFGIEEIGPIWFLVALFGAQIEIVYIAKLIRDDIKRMIIISLLAFLAYWCGRIIWIPCSIWNALAAAPFLFAGNIFKRVDLHISKVSYFIIACFISFIVIVGEFCKHEEFNLARLQFPLYGLSILGGFSGTYLVAYICKKLENLKIMEILNLIGRSSLGIMCVHAIDLECLIWPLWNGKMVLISRIFLTILVGIFVQIILSIVNNKN